MKQASYSLVDFLKDPDFRDWVKHPDEASEIYWQEFQEKYPHQKPAVEQARQYILVLAEQTSQQLPSTDESQLMRQNIRARIREEEGVIPFTPSVANPWRWARMAASITLVLGLGLLAYWYSQSRPNQPIGYQKFLKSSSGGTALSEIRNPDTKPLTISLSDGSSVVLQPGSRLSYPNKFTQREVYLVGKAFFEVVRNPSKPFLVYTRGVATKVLGTSFSIDAPETNQPIKVAVKTGRVAVYSLDKPAATTPKATDATLNGLVLTPNQSVEYLADSHQLIRRTDTTTTFAQPGTLTVAKQSFDFDETPVSEVFRTLEKAYGVDIVYDESQLGNCSLSATLVGQPFHEKISVVCKALEAQYSFQGNQVVITGGQHCQ
jgi:ferric-dicitrate binding protein FerR (iron transport regulator)